MKTIYLAVFVLPFYFCYAYAYAQVVCYCDDGITDGCFYSPYFCIDETGSCTCSSDINCVNKLQQFVLRKRKVASPHIKKC